MNYLSVAPEPTKAQLRELWERCGHTGRLESIQPVDGQEEGKLVYVSPPPNLDNLFKYAVPKAVEKLQDIDLSTEVEAYYKLFDLWIKKALERHHNSPDSADLFWALWEVI